MTAMAATAKKPDCYYRGNYGYGPLLVLGALLVSRAGAACALGFRPFDDTYITFRYARNLAEGHGFVYNLGERILGTTTPLWTLVISLGLVLHLPVQSWAIACSLICDAGAALLIFEALLKLEFSDAVATLAAALFLLQVDYLALALSGMESSLFVFLIIAALYAAVAEHYLAAMLASGLAVMTRPEGCLLLLVVPTIAVVKARGLLNFRRAASTMIIGAAPLAGWVVFALFYFHSPIPQSVIAKADQARTAPAMHAFSNRNLIQFFIHGEVGAGLLKRTYLQGQCALSMLALLGCVSLASGRKEGAVVRALAILAFPMGFILVMAWAGAFTWYPWYYAPIYPFLAILAALGIEELICSVSRMGLRPWPVAIGFAIALGSLQVTALLKVKIPQSRSDFWLEGLALTSHYVPSNPAVTVASDEIGIVGWLGYPVRVDDLAGLVTPEVVGQSTFEHLSHTRPEFISLRTDNAGELLASALFSRWISSNYRMVASVSDPFRARDFRLYRRLSDGNSSSSSGRRVAADAHVSFAQNPDPPKRWDASSGDR